MEFYELVNNIKADLPNFDIWHISFINDNLPYLFNFLTENEKALYYGYSRQKSRLEFLGGRVLLKFCISKYLGSTFNSRQISINRSNNGVPQLFINGKKVEDIYFSISHRKGYIFSAVDNSYRVAVDVEKVSNKFLRLGKYYLTPTEEAIIQRQEGFTLVELLTMLWSAKELVSKYLKGYHFMRVLRSARLISIKNDMLEISFLDRGYELTFLSKAFFYKGYAFSYLVNS